MLSVKQYLNARSSPFAIKKLKQLLQEGTELSASDFLDELTAPQVHSVTAKVIAETENELTIHLQIKKWSGGN